MPASGQRLVSPDNRALKLAQQPLQFAHNFAKCARSQPSPAAKRPDSAVCGRSGLCSRISPGRSLGVLLLKGSSIREGARLDTIEYHARCHCGALSACYRTALPPSAWHIRACQCSFCRSHAALSTSDPAGLIAYQCSDPKLLQRYRFGTGSAEFLICRACGVYLGAQITSGCKRFGILNALALRPIPPDLPQAEPMDYGDETAEIRRQRRQSRWTPVASESV